MDAGDDAGVGLDHGDGDDLVVFVLGLGYVEFGV